MFPGAGATVYRNEAGEPTGWDSGGYYDEPYDPDDFLADDYDGEDEMIDETTCGSCGEPADDEMAEVFDPKSTADDGDVKVVHVSCIPDGYVLA